MWVTWRQAMQTALYGPGGFYARGEPPARHFRTSVRASPRYAGAILTLVRHIDAALGHPARIDLVDVGAGRGELLGQILAAAAAEPDLARRIAAHAVEVVPRPAGLDRRIRWSTSPPPAITGLVVASEWLDNIPLDVVELTAAGVAVVLTDPDTGAERHGPSAGPADLDWVRTWWPLRTPGDRAEVGRARSQAWAGLVRRISRGLALAADYGHVRATRPACGTLAAYLEGRAVPPVPDGSRDITAHVAFDACAAAGRCAGATETLLTTQRDALRALGVTGQRPPLALAASDPEAYVRRLCHASEDAELTDVRGLGGFGWLVQTVGMKLPAPLRARTYQGAPSGS